MSDILLKSSEMVTKANPYNYTVKTKLLINFKKEYDCISMKYH